MADVPSEYLEQVFDNAVSDYTDIDQPFGVTQLRKAWNDMQNEMRNELLKAETAEIVTELKIMGECVHDYETQPPDPEDAELFESVKVCVKCDHAIPKFRKSDKAQRAAAYLQIARRA